MKNRTPIQKRIHAAELAKDAFLRAAAALTEGPKPGVVAFALLEASIGLLRLAECDDEEQSARARVEQRLREEARARLEELGT